MHWQDWRCRHPRMIHNWIALFRPVALPLSCIYDGSRTKLEHGLSGVPCCRLWYIHHSVDHIQKYISSLDTVLDRLCLLFGWWWYSYVKRPPFKQGIWEELFSMVPQINNPPVISMTTIWTWWKRITSQNANERAIVGIMRIQNIQLSVITSSWHTAIWFQQH